MKVIGDNAFYCCTSLTNVEICSGVERIGTSAFAGNNSLTSISIPGTVKIIGYQAFENSTALTSVEIEQGLERIGMAAFDFCPNLNSFKAADAPSDFDLVLPDTVSSVDDNAFGYCSNLKSAYLGGKDLVIGNYAFTVTGLEKVDLGNTVSLGDEVFSGSKIATMEIPQALTDLSPKAFDSCPELKTITINPDTPVYMKHGNLIIRKTDSFIIRAFGEASIPADIMIKGIGEYAFSSVTLDKASVIPDTVNYIGAYAFEDNDTQHLEITIPRSVVYVGENAFRYVNYWTLVIEGDTSEWNPLWAERADITIVNKE